jgi:hypothetical protein
MPSTPEPCFMRSTRNDGRCGDAPAGLYEFTCPRDHVEKCWLCLRHGEQAIAGLPRTLCETCAGRGVKVPVTVRLIELAR